MAAFERTRNPSGKCLLQFAMEILRSGRAARRHAGARQCRLLCCNALPQECCPQSQHGPGKGRSASKIATLHGIGRRYRPASRLPTPACRPRLVTQACGRYRSAPHGVPLAAGKVPEIGVTDCPGFLSIRIEIEIGIEIRIGISDPTSGPCMQPEWTSWTTWTTQCAVRKYRCHWCAVDNRLATGETAPADGKLLPGRHTGQPPRDSILRSGMA